MTREEADFIGAMNMCDEISNEAYKKIMCNCEEQEPCEDAVSRQEIQQKINRLWNSGADKDYCMETLKDFVTELQPVTPTHKKGKWEQYGNYWEDKFKCSECGKEQPKILCGERIIGHWSDYCPNCGAEMRGE